MHRMHKQGVSSFLVSLVCLCVVSAGFSVSHAQAPEFPRLGHYMGPAPLDEPEMQAYLAKLDFAVVMVWPGWRGRSGATVEQALAPVKKASPRTKVFAYVANNELWDSADQYDAWRELREKIYAESWWLYSSGRGGARVKSTWGETHHIMNTSNFSPRDGSGKNFNEWFADWSVATFVTPNPSIDGLFTDNVFWKPRVDGDWDRDGTRDLQGSATTQQWFREGYRAYFQRMKQAMPSGKLVLGNVADWPEAKNAGRGIPEYDGLLNGGVLEAAAGKSYSIESWGGWSEMMRWYRETLAKMASPGLLLVEVFGDATDYQSMRYGLTSTLMDDGYFQYADISGRKLALWFDEYDVKLGKALSEPPIRAWKDGVYRRDFEYGVALVNPKGNGVKTVELDNEYRHIAGSQATTVNTGRLTRSVTLRDRDGVILLRSAPKARPLPPANVTVD
jgi:hypothetical protein